MYLKRTIAMSALPQDRDFITKCIQILKLIEDGTVDDCYEGEQWMSHAWELYNTVWPNGPPDGISVTRYQTSILQECWYMLEAYDPECLADMHVNRDQLRHSAKACRELLLDKDADPASEPFLDWFDPRYKQEHSLGSTATSGGSGALTG